MNKDSLNKEFQQYYENTNGVPMLPERLSDYRFISCLEDSPQKKSWLLEKKSNGQKVLCKYGTGEYITMLRTENDCHTLGKFSFFPYVFDYFETKDGAYLLREYIEGQSLTEQVEKNGPFPLMDAVRIMDQVCSQLAKLHQAVPPIIYRDLKPSNIVISPSGDCYLIDFGTIRTYHKDTSADTIFIGTPETAAPEQFGARQTDQRTDIYGLGILFYYLITGELRICEKQIKKLPPKITGIIQKCTSFDPDNRYSDVEKVKRAVNSLIPDKKLFGYRLTALISFCAFLFTLFLLIAPRFAPSAREVTFSSPLLEQAVREELQRTNDEPIYEKDLAGVTQILICGNTIFHNRTEHEQYLEAHTVNGTDPEQGDITDISLLSKMPNLHYVILDSQKIYDISPLKGKKLTELSLCNNPITDISSLSGCSTLQKLSINQTGVTSLAPLSDCTSLMELDCSLSPIVSLAPLRSLPLHILYMADISASDYEELEHLPLEKLVCRHISKEDISAFANISSLQDLTIYSSGITSLSEVRGLTHLVRLDLYNNSINNLEGIEEFQNLSQLALGNNQITDFSPLIPMTNLTSLDIPTRGDVDFSFLLQMPWVEEINISSGQLDSLYEIIPEPWFNVSYY